MDSVRRFFHDLLSRVLRFLMGVDRVRWVLFFFFCFGAYILVTTFRYTVLDHGYYRGLADRQHTVELTDDAPRGAIYSNNDPKGIFSMSTSLPDIAIDPGQPGSKEKLVSFLTDVLYEEMCVYATTGDCYTNLLAFLRLTEMPEYQETPDFVRGRIQDGIKARLSREYVDNVEIVSEVSDKDCIDVNLAAKNGLRCQGGSVLANPLEIVNSGSVASYLQTKFGLEPETALKTLQLRKVRYVKIYRRLSLRSKEKIDKRVENEKDAIAKGLLDDAQATYPFIILESHPTRFYPERSIAGKLTGFVDHENRGQYGIEGYFDRELRGQQGIKLTQKDAAGRIIGAYDLTEQDFANGMNLHLTVDRNIQKEVSRLLQNAVEEFKANKGTVVVMDPRTGAIISMADYPTFDPNEFGSVYDMEKVSPKKYPNPAFSFLGQPIFVEDSIEGIQYVVQGKPMKLRRATDAEISNPAVPKYRYKNSFGPGVYVNNAIGSLYEPGSVFKAITVAIGIDTGDITPNDRYVDKGYVTIDTYRIKNVDSECIGNHTYLHALDFSCNVGMIDIVQKIGKALFYKYILDFGFDAKTNITLEGEVFARIDPYELWSRAKLFTMSFGQGITVTPLQMAAAYSVLANGGIYMEPYIVDSIELANGTVIKNAPKPLRRVIAADTSKKVIAMLTDGARVGFAKAAAIAGYDIAGKTGTSQIASKGGYEEGGAGHTITSFGGFAPSSDPRFVVIVTVDRPRTAVYSESTSSVLFKRVTEFLLNYYRIPKNDASVVTADSSGN